MICATNDGKEFQTSTSSVLTSQPCRHFDFPEILIATENFVESLVIGKGGFGNVYKGNVIIGSSVRVAAIKRLDNMSNQGASEFWAEVETLSRLRHCNLVSLFGYCNYENEMILVYEYMPNGTLYDHLHTLHTPLSWVQRLRICIGASRGLHYLHTGTGIESGVIHRDVKSSNILLHDSWAAKISDFGLSKIGPTNMPSTYVNTLVKGTFGYLDPDYFTTGRLTRKSDVYAFGVVLLEVLCRKRAVDRSLDEEQWGLVPWVQDSIIEGNLKHIIDSDISSQISPKCLKEFIRIAERCLHDNPKQRPTMAEVVVGLEFVLALQEKLNKSLQYGSRTILSKMVNILCFTSNRVKSVHRDSKISSNNKVKSMFPEMKEVPADNFQSPRTSLKEVPADNFQISPRTSLKEFRFDDLKIATREFSTDLLLDERGFRKVFLGWVDQDTLAPSKQGVGIAVAVKRSTSKSDHGYPEWLTEVNILGQLSHPNIIRLLGYCKDEPDHLLVYEYMPNKSFEHFLFIDDIGKPFSWGTRLLIMIGVARGLAYLHSRNVFHHSLKCSHILLDEDFNAKVGGFGLAVYKPKIGETGHLSMMRDIYNFGMVLLESISGRRALDLSLPDGKPNLVDLAIQIKSDRRKLKKIMDPRLEHNYPLQGALEFVALALRCLKRKPKDRPSSEEVLQTLEQIYALHK